jgi:hypothetical protein
VLEAALVLPGWWKGYRTADAALLVGAQFTPLAAQAQLSDTTLVVQGAADPAAQSAPVALEAGKYLVTVSYTSDTGDATLAPEDAALGWDTGSVGLGKSSSGVENAWLTVPQGGAEVTFTVANGASRTFPSRRVRRECAAQHCWRHCCWRWMRRRLALELPSAAARTAKAYLPLRCWRQLL